MDKTQLKAFAGRWLIHKVELGRFPEPILVREYKGSDLKALQEPDGKLKFLSLLLWGICDSDGNPFFDWKSESDQAEVESMFYDDEVFALVDKISGKKTDSDVEVEKKD